MARLRLPAGAFLGTAQRRLELQHVVLVESCYACGDRQPPHSHAGAFFDLVLAGSCTETIGRRSRERRPHSLMFHPAGEEHASQWHDTQARCFHIEIAPATLERVPAIPAGDANASWIATRIYDELCAMDAVSPLAIEALALEMVVATARGARPAPRWIARVRDALDDATDTPSLASLATEAGVHAAHLARTFRRAYGCSIGDYARRQRIQRACTLLATDASLAEIATSLGFADQSHFTRAFKQVMRVTPARYRRSTPRSDRSRR
jgi:AraC family transcriptional regulator